VVQRRRHELAIRLALGAGRGRIVRLITRQLSLLLVVGCAIGVALALALARGASTLLFGLSWYDPWALGASLAMLAGIAAVACAVPALRASRIKEASALFSQV
jgi:putative ABC transport system permease protein